MIDIDGKYYIIDMDAMMQWISETPNSERNINTITTMTYPIIEGEEITEKEISENKSTLNDVMNNIRYDFIRNLLNVLFTTFTNELNQIVSFTMEELTFSQKIVFNTLLNKNIIKELTEIKK